jgi:MFS transporter, DHA3 family, tetracycline resistance protein
MLLTGGHAFLLSLAITVNLIFQTQEAGLDPLQLLLVGTALVGTIFVCEIPTGMLADLRGRRFSIVCGLLFLGAGFALNGAFARFDTIFAAQFLLGIGMTFISGAQQAWIADEIGVDSAMPVYLRASQVDQTMRLVAIPVSVAIATIDLNLPLLLTGAFLPLLAVVMQLSMSEEGFRRDAGSEPSTLAQRLTGTLTASTALVRASPLLMTMLAITVFYGIAGQGFDRLWVAHFYDNLGFPETGDLEPVLWFGVVRFGSSVMSILAVELVHRRVDATSHASVSRWLFAINAGQGLSVLVFALSGGFWLGMAAVWAAISLSRMFDPLLISWINQNVHSAVRATVISMSSQTTSIGQIAGGPLLGVIGSLATLRAALLASGIVLAPALVLYTRAFKLGARDVARAPESLTS